MPPIQYAPDTVTSEAEIRARAKAARERLRGPLAPRPVVVRQTPAPPPPSPPPAPPPPPAPSFMRANPPRLKLALEPEPVAVPPRKLPPALPQEPNPDVSRFPIAAIIAATARHLKISVDLLMNGGRSLRYARPRQIAMYIAHKQGYMGSTIARAFGGLDHTTAIHAKWKIEELLEKGDTEIAAAIKDITGALQVQFPNVGKAREEDDEPPPPRRAAKGKRWTEEENDLALQLRKEGMTIKAIALKLGKPPQTVRNKTRRIRVQGVR